MAPEGRFFVPLDPTASRHYLGIAGGSGITPILSIMKTVLAAEPQSRFTLIYGNRKLRSTMFMEEIEDLKNRYLSRLTLHLVFSQEATDLPLHNGRLDRAKIAEFLRQPLVDAASARPRVRLRPARRQRRGRGGAARCGHRARAHPHRALRHARRRRAPRRAAAAAAARRRRAPTRTITIIRDGVRSEIDFHAAQGNVLDAAAAAGLEVPFSCKSGVCCTCRAKLLEGEVRMERNFALEKHEVAAGFVLTCQSHPLTDRVVISFDDR